MYGQICKDKDEAEIWFVGLKALVTRGNSCKGRLDSRCDSLNSDSSQSRSRKNTPSVTPFVCSSDFYFLVISE